jgi:hypothetical protein
MLQPFTRWYLIISTFSALVALGVQGATLKYGFYNLNVFSFLFSLLMGIGVYFALYKGLTNLFRVWAWKKILSRFDIHGVWYHEFRAASGYARRGRTRVTQGVFTLRFLGVNYDPTFEQSSRSLWESHALTLDETGRLIFSYTVTRTGPSKVDDEKTRHLSSIAKKGLMTVHLHHNSGRRPHKMIGEFEDSAFQRGAITWLREPPEWAKSLEEAEEVSDLDKVHGVAVNKRSPDA